MGKFIENWQLGYAFNPLGLTDPYHHNNNDDDLNEQMGINAVAMRYIEDDISLDFYASDDDEVHNNIHNYGYKSQAVRLNYILNDRADISLIAQKKQDMKIGFGAGFRNIANNNSKIYGSFFTRRGTTLASLSATGIVDSYRTHNNKHYTRAMLGWHWTSDDNVSIIVEISQDDRGMNDQEWQNYTALTDAGLTLVRPDGLRQRYHFLRFGKIIDDHEFSLSRRTSSDDSALNTLKWRYDINEDLQLNTSFSATTGASDSEYKVYFPEQSKTNIILRYNFSF